MSQLSFDFAAGNAPIDPAALADLLEEIVTTATGDQRRSEIGNAVTTLGDVNKSVEMPATVSLGWP